MTRDEILARIVRLQELEAELDDEIQSTRELIGEAENPTSAQRAMARVDELLERLRQFYPTIKH